MGSKAPREIYRDYVSKFKTSKTQYKGKKRAGRELDRGVSVKDLLGMGGALGPASSTEKKKIEKEFVNVTDSI